MRKYEVVDYLVMGAVCLVLFAIPYAGRYVMDHSKAALAIIFAGAAFWFFNKR